jgi:cell division protease FtsH
MTISLLSLMAKHGLPVTDWHVLADDLLARLARASGRDFAFIDATPVSRVAPSASAKPTAHPTSAEELDDIFAELDRELEDEDRAGHRPTFIPAEDLVLRPRAEVLISVLRIAKSLQTRLRLNNICADRSRISLIITNAPRLDPVIARILGIAVDRDLMGEADVKPYIACVTETVRLGGEDQGKIFGGLGDTLRDAIQRGRPIILVASVYAGLSKAIKGLDTTPIELAAMDEEMLSLALHLGFPLADAIKLPSGMRVGRLEPEDLSMAFRAATSGEALDLISRRLSPKASKGPGLMDFPLPPAVKSTLQLMIQDMQAWHSGEIPWSEVTRGILLVGPPGTGKTEIARLLAQEAGFETIATSLAQWSAESARSGDMIKAMRSAFSRAASSAPSILYIDELDSIGDRNRASDQNTAWSDFIIGALLEALDGFAERAGVVIIGATNHLAKIDPAIRRPGRFDMIVRLENPGTDLMPDVFRWHLGKDLPAGDLVGLAHMAGDMSGAQVAAAVRAARSKARAARRALSVLDLEAEIQMIRPPLPSEMHWRVALHEAGHAIVAAIKGTAAPRVLAIGSGGGRIDMEGNPRALTRDGVMGTLCCLMGGRAAEQLVLGEYSAGAGGGSDSDLAKATQIATAAEISWGLGSSRVWLGDAEHGVSRLVQDAMLRQKIEVQLSRAECEAGRLLEIHREVLIDLATALCRHHRIEGSDLARLLSRLQTTDVSAGVGISGLLQ